MTSAGGTPPIRYPIKAFANNWNSFLAGCFAYRCEYVGLSINSIELVRPDSTSLKFSVDMIDLAERLEVGRLKIQEVDALGDLKHVTPLPKVLSADVEVTRLVLKNEYGEVESGVEIFDPASGARLSLVAGAAPYSIVLIAAFTDNSSAPEYEMETYCREEM